jgi:hypothetical protein
MIVKCLQMGREYPCEKDQGKSPIKWSSIRCFYLLTQQLAGANYRVSTMKRRNKEKQYTDIGQTRIHVGCSVAQ